MDKLFLSGVAAATTILAVLGWATAFDQLAARRRMERRQATARVAGYNRHPRDHGGE